MTTLNLLCKGHTFVESLTAFRGDFLLWWFHFVPFMLAVIEIQIVYRIPLVERFI